MNFFATKPTTVDGVMAAFNTAITDLQGVAEAQTERAAAQARIVADAQAAQAAAEAEAARANDVAAKMKALLA